jgi:hypothetical protein
VKAMETFKHRRGKHGIELYDGDRDCRHRIISLWSGVKCTKCRGWFCY